VLPYTATDIVRLTNMEIEREIEQLAKRYPNGMPLRESRKFSPFRFGRKRRQA
jgi:hypothetical protein